MNKLDTLAKEIATFCAEFRADNKLSLRNIGSSLGVTRMSFSNWEKGVNVPGRRQVAALSKETHPEFVSRLAELVLEYYIVETQHILGV